MTPRQFLGFVFLSLSPFIFVQQSSSSSRVFAARGAPERKNKKESSETAVVTIREHFISISQGSDQSKKNQKKEKKDENTYALMAHQHTGRHRLCWLLPLLTTVNWRILSQTPADNHYYYDSNDKWRLTLIKRRPTVGPTTKETTADYRWMKGENVIDSGSVIIIQL